MAALAEKLNGAVLMGHSESGFFPEQAALIDPSGIRGIISIEMPCVTNFNAGAARDAREDPDPRHVRRSSGRRRGRPRELGTVVRELQQVRRSAEESGRRRRDDAPAAMGIKGNSHMLMQDKNSTAARGPVIAWIDKHVEKKK